MAALIVIAVGLTSYSLSQEKTRNFMLEEVIRLSLSQCYETPTDGVVEGDEVVLTVALDESGTMALMPELMTTTDLTPGESALIREANVALFLCTPITSANRSKAIHGEFELAVNKNGIRVSKVDANVIDLVAIPENTPESPDVPDSPDGEDGEMVSVATEGDAEGVTVETEGEAMQDAGDEATEMVADAQVHMMATEENEDLLELSRADKRNIQRRLVLAGYNTRGVDGVFGKGSRAAISAWQGDGGIPVSSYLNVDQIAMLNEQTEADLVRWNNRPRRYVGRNGCLREPNGRIVSGRSFNCDMSAMGQDLGLVK